MSGKSGKSTDTGATNALTDTPPAAAGIGTLHSSDLFAGSREVIILHQGDQYRLRCTSKGKLLLTK